MTAHGSSAPSPCLFNPTLAGRFLPSHTWSYCQVLESPPLHLPPSIPDTAKQSSIRRLLPGPEFLVPKGPPQAPCISIFSRLTQRQFLFPGQGGLCLPPVGQAKGASSGSLLSKAFGKDSLPGLHFGFPLTDLPQLFLSISRSERDSLLIGSLWQSRAFLSAPACPCAFSH